MSDLELVLTMLSEATTTELTKTKNPQGLDENKKVANEGGKIAGKTRKEIEEASGRPVITEKNATQLNEVVTGMIERISDI